MYRPADFRIDDTPRLLEFVSKYSFATLVTHGEGGMIASHVPALLTENRSLFVHLAKANPQSDQLAAGAEALCIFQGPHCYISPSWYAIQPAVPTWNYAAVHAYGRPRVLDAEELLSSIAKLVDVYESMQPQPWIFDTRLDWNRRMLNGITGFAISLDRMEGKFKMSQNRSAADRERVIARLQQSTHPMENEVAAWVKANSPDVR